MYASDGAAWPATGESLAVAVPLAQGGVKGWFRSMAIPRRWAVKPWGVAPVGIAVARMPCGAWDGGVIICRGLSLLLRPFMGLAGAFCFAMELK